ncbi:unnamed protein product [Cuscuta campestris]|uniref:Uncharacterized protein n=1 Tax=Cuscuta campestris TaxID=132261 RepID=A0A484NGU4_9ASTE|nr:unnamed protein product [Cuscuta campestris]
MTRPVSWRGNPDFAAMAARAFRFVTLRSRSGPQRLGETIITVCLIVNLRSFWCLQPWVRSAYALEIFFMD